MGVIITNRSELIGRTSEIIGFKSGLGLNRDEFAEIIPHKFYDLWFGEDDAMIRFRSEVYEELISHLLYEVGNTATPSHVSPTILLSKKYRDNPETAKMYLDLMQLFIKFQQNAIQAARVLQKRN